MSYISQKYNIPADTVLKMAKDGIIDWRINYLHEFYTFYNELLKGYEDDGETYPKGLARNEIMLHYKLSQRNFYRWMKVCRTFFDNDVAQIIE